MTMTGLLNNRVRCNNSRDEHDVVPVQRRTHQRADALPEVVVRNLGHNLQAEPRDEERSRGGGTQPPRLQVEQPLLLEVRYGAPVRAHHVVGDDLEVGLDVHRRLGDEEQVAGDLARVRSLRQLVHLHVPVEHSAAGRGGDDALVNLVRGPLLVVQHHLGVEVQALALSRQVETRQLGVCPRAQLRHAQVVTPEPTPDVDLRELVLRLLRLRQVRGAGVHRRPGLRLHHRVRHLRALLQHQLAHAVVPVRPILRAPRRGELLDDAHGRPLAHVHRDARRGRRHLPILRRGVRGGQLDDVDGRREGFSRGDVDHDRIRRGRGVDLREHPGAPHGAHLADHLRRRPERDGGDDDPVVARRAGDV
mmetsp:Transcript_2591/g.11082  ORF Transcript_2591/g.11082 Transcript_2591/m.11082 type:complete len:362 (+) Transcript_2591:97-1182(+)